MKTLVAVPTHNERDSIEAVLRETLRHVSDVLVIDDGSDDGTREILKGIPEVKVLRHDTNQGYGQSIIDGFNYAIEHGYEAVLTLDADGQHEPSHIPVFISELAHVDIVSGSRYLTDLDDDSMPPPDRMRINRTITEELWRRFGLKVTDAFCGYKAYRTDALRDMKLTETGYAMPVELWVQAAGLGLRIREIPVRRIYISTAERKFGGSLDEPEVRLRYYLEVLNSATTAVALQGAEAEADVEPEELCGNRWVKHPNRVCQFQRE